MYWQMFLRKLFDSLTVLFIVQDHKYHNNYTLFSSSCDLFLLRKS